jgi:hypothetical protein
MDFNSRQEEEGKSVSNERSGDMRLITWATMMLVCAILFSAVGCQFSSKILQHPLLVGNPSEPSAEVYFFREDVIWQSGLATSVAVNGDTLLQLRRATYAKVSLKPGKVHVEGGPRATFQLVTPAPSFECGIPMELEPRKTYFVLLSYYVYDEYAYKWCFRPNLITEEGARSLMTTYTVVGQ